MRNVAKIIGEAAEKLRAASVERPPWTARQLLASIKGMAPWQMDLEKPPFTEEELVQFESAVAARANRVPLQYLMETAGFFGRDFWVGPGVFIPRPETEVLIEAALELLQTRFVHRPSSIVHRSSFIDQRSAIDDSRLVVLDVGTGSGAIAVTLALEAPGPQYLAVDRSWAALSFARRNARRYQAPVLFFQGDLAKVCAPESLDLMIANLPYLDPAQAAVWPGELHWEPWMALDGGPEGRALVDRLLLCAAAPLRKEGLLLLEIGGGQEKAVASRARRLRWKVEAVIRDLAGIERVVVLKKRSEIRRQRSEDRGQRLEAKQ